MNSVTIGAVQKSGPYGDPADPEGAGIPEAPNLPPVKVNKWTIEQAEKYWKVGEAAQKAGGSFDGSNVDFGALVKAVTVGAAAGAAAGGVGAAVGAVIGAITYFIGNLFSGPSEWDGIDPAVHAWFTQYGQEDYLQWVRAHAPNYFGSVQQAAEGQMLFWLERYGMIIYGGHPSGYGNIPGDAYLAQGGGYEAVRRLYRDWGVDYNGTYQGRYVDGTLSGSQMLMLNAKMADPGGDDGGTADEVDPPKETTGSNAAMPLLLLGAAYMMSK